MTPAAATKRARRRTWASRWCAGAATWAAWACWCWCRFAALFHTVAQAQKAALVPFLLQGVADGPEPTKLFQADRIHPTAQAQPTMLENVWPALKKLL